MIQILDSVGWLACVVYATVPGFWLLIHPRAERWRVHRRSPYLVLLPAWMAMWSVTALLTFSWRHTKLYSTPWTWAAAAPLLGIGFWIYSQSGKNFSLQQLGGLPEILRRHSEQRLVVDGIRARVRHPVYLAHLCEMLAWSLGSGLLACYALTAFAMATGAVMIRTEERELEERFGDAYRRYKDQVPAVLPRLGVGQ